MTHEKRSFIFGFVFALFLCVVPIVGDIILAILDSFKLTVWNPIIGNANRMTSEVLHNEAVEEFRNRKTKRSPGNTFIYSEEGTFVVDENGNKWTLEEFKRNRGL